MLNLLSLEPESFGLDINDLSLKIVKIKKSRRSWDLTSYNEVNIEPGIIKEGIIKNEETLTEIIKNSLNTVKGKKIKTKYVVASLPEEKSFFQIIQLPKMEKEELRSAVIFEAENYIPMPIEEVYLDFQVIEPVVNHLNHLDVLVGAMPKTIVDSYVSCLKKAGLIPWALEIESQAIARALVKNETSVAPLVLIDFGENNTQLIIFAGHSIRFTCSIPISSQRLTLAIAESLKIDPNEAEKIKIKYSLSDEKEKNKIFQAITPILNELVMQIEKYLEFYQEHSSHEHLPPNGKLEKILLCGGGANLKGLTDFLSQKLKITVEEGKPLINFPLKKNNKIPAFISKKLLSFTTAIGLALKDI